MSDDGNLATGIPQAVVEAHLVEGKTMLKAWRQYLQMSQVDVAEAMGMTIAAYKDLEANENIDASTLKRLAKALGICADNIFN
jgi:predicted transcriptional regulator